MENQYGIAVKNKYELFLEEDEDPLEILRLQEEAKLKKKDDKTKKDAKNEKTVKQAKSKQTKKTVTPVSDAKPGTDLNANKREDRPRNRPPRQEREGGGDRPQGSRPPREGGFREGGFGPREGGFREGGFRGGDRPPRRDQGERGERQPSGEFRERSGDRPEGGGRGRGGFGRGRGRGGRGRGGFDRFGKRDFDRHSGSDKTSSGVKPTEKREGGGAHNWGTVKDDMDREQLNDSNISEENQDWAGQPEEVENQDPNAAENAEEEVPQEEPVREMTLDEYKAQQEKARTKSAFNIRRANEGSDETQWKKTYVYKKKPVKGEDEEEEEEEESDDEFDPRKKNVVPIKITFNDTPRFGGRGGRRGRGGRGGGDRGGGTGDRGGDRGGDRPERGGGRGRGGDRVERGGGFRSRGKEAAAPHIEDENDFPSLVKPASS